LVTNTNPIGNTFLLTDTADTLLGLEYDMRTLDMDNEQCLKHIEDLLTDCIYNITQYVRESQHIYSVD